MCTPSSTTLTGCNGLGSCKDYIAQVQCIKNIAKGYTSWIEIQLIDIQGNPLDQNDFIMIKIAVFDDMNRILDTWSTDPDTTENLLELVEGIARLRLDGERLNLLISGNVFAEVMFYKQEETDMDSFSFSGCLKVANLHNSVFKIGKSIDEEKLSHEEKLLA